jgi:hypothetical protein
VRRLTLWFLVAALVFSGAACRTDGVRLAFRPDPGSRYVYRVEVHAEVVTRIGDTEERRRVDDDVLFADHDVLVAGPRSSTVRVRLRGEGQPPRTFQVRLDRAARLAEVERIEGLPASALGELGLSEIFPAAAGAPPDRLLAPGERWQVDEPITLPGQGLSRLRGEGRLVELGVVDGLEVARVDTTFRLPVEQTTDEAQGRIVLRGEQSVHARSTSMIGDGAVYSAETETRGRYTLQLLPRDGGAAVPGELEIVVRSTTRRIG